MKFYIISKDSIKLSNNHIVIPTDYNDNKIFNGWIINLTDDELHNLWYGYIYSENFLRWSYYKENISLYNFLKTKHNFKTISYRNIFFTTNYFDLDEHDLMYMRLMDWIQI